MRAEVKYSRDFGKPKLLERYPDLTIASGVGVQAAFVAGKPLIAWSGRTAVRASLDGRTTDLAPIPADGNWNDGLTDLAVSGDDAVAVMNSGTQVFAAPLTGGAFGPTEAVSGVGQYLGRASADFDGARAIVAWTVPGAGVEVAQRAFGS
jgi:hypothetical protein